MPMSRLDRSPGEPPRCERRRKAEPGKFARLFVALLVAAAFATTQASAAERLRIAAQKTGTLAWELEIIHAAGLDRQLDLNIETTELASTEAGKIALKGGSADLIVTDWLWVGRERALGDNLVFYPYSSALGAVMAPANSSIKGIPDLVGKKIGVAGGPLDKSWLLLQALAKRSGVDLKTQAQLAYGAPPLLTQKALQGETDATLTFWNFCAELEGKGLKRGIDMEETLKRLGASGPVAMLGYVFDASWAVKNKAAVGRFLAIAAEAKDILATSPEEWQRLSARIGVTDAAALDIYRKRYSEGIPRRPIADEERDAIGLYRVLAEAGGSELVGPAREMDKGTFYDPEKSD